MASPTDLAVYFKKVLGIDSVYYNPDSNITLKYPCIIFSIDRENSRYADNKRYMSQLRYTVTLVTRNAVDLLIAKLMDNFNYLSLDRTYRTSGLYHYVFVLYF